MPAISEDEYLHTSYDGIDREFRDGEILERGEPTFQHGDTQGAAAAFFCGLRKSKNLYPGISTRIRLRPGRYVVPDVSVFWPNEPTTAIPEDLPLIVIEILSPDERMMAVIAKLIEYQSYGIPHIWLLDPEHNTFYTFHGRLKPVQSATIPEVGIEFHFADLSGAGLQAGA
ncbi:MAG: Uma2 family endonuclease [Bryobacteraceae bacterium]